MIARLLSAVCCLLAASAASALDWTLAEGQAVVRSDPSLGRPVMVTVVFDAPAPEGLVLRSPWGAYAQVALTRTGPLIALASPVPGEPIYTPGEIAIPAGVTRFTCPLPGVSVVADASADADWATDLDIRIPGLSERRLALQVINPARGPAVLLAAIPPVAVGQQAVLQAQVDDPAGQGVQVTWSQVSGPSLDLGDAAGFQRVAQVLSMPTVGDYVLRCTVTDANGRAASMDVSLARVRPRIVVGDTLQLTAALVDQFGDLIPSADLAWTVDGGGSVDAQGVFSPGDVPGLRQITVSAPAAALSDVLAVQVAGFPALSWATPAPLPVGGALDATRLNAVSSVPGTFSYTPPAGTVLSTAGTISLRADFTPADADAWEPASVSSAVVVQGGDGGDDGQAGPSVPTVTLSFTAGLTGVGTATVDGQTLSFTNHESKQVTVAATAVSDGVIDGIVLMASDGRSWPLSSPGSQVVSVPDEGRLEFSATATATRNGQSATGSTAAPLVLMVDRTPPRVSWEVAAAAAGGTSEPLPTGLIWLGGGSAADALATRTTYGVVCYPKAGFALEGTVDDLSGLAGTGQQVAFVSHDGTRTGLTIDAAAQPIQVALPANAPAQATVVPATLMLQVEGDAGFEATLVDRAGNPATGRFAQLRIKDAAPLAAVGGLALNPSNGEETVINLDGWTSYTPMQTIVTSCDVIAVEQSGKHAVRLSNGPAVLGHGGHRRIAWLVPQPVSVGVSTPATVALKLTDLSGQSMSWTGAVKLRAHRQSSFPDQSLVMQNHSVVVVDYNEIYFPLDILSVFGVPERIWERRFDLPPWDIAIITGAYDFGNGSGFEIPGQVGIVAQSFAPLDDPPRELPIENSAFMAFLAGDDYDSDDQFVAPRAVDPQEWAQTKAGSIQRFWEDNGYRDEVQFLNRLADLSNPATGRINTKGGAEYIRNLNAPEGVRPILGLRHSRSEPATGTILWSERAQRETPRILVAPPSWNRSAEGRLENLRLVDAGGLAASGGQAWVMWCGADATAVPPQVNEYRASIEVPVTRSTPPGLAQITWSLNRDPLETRIATQVPNTIRSDAYFTVWEESPTSVVTQSRLPLRVQGGHRSANVLRVINDVLVSGGTSELVIAGAFADTWPAPAAEMAFYDTRDIAFMRSLIGDGTRKTARANLLAWLTSEHERLMELERDDATLIQAMIGHRRWSDVNFAITQGMRLAELSAVPSPEPELYQSLVLDPYEAAQRVVDSAKAAVDAGSGDGVALARLWRAWKIAEQQAEMVLCDGLDAYLREAERQNPGMDPSGAEALVWNAWVAFINRVNANQMEGDGPGRAANGMDPYLGDWEEIDFLGSDTYREAIEALEGSPDSNLPLLAHARDVQSAGRWYPNAHEILTVTGAYADRTWREDLPEEAVAYRIRVGQSKVIGLDHLAPMRQELRVQLDIGSEVVGLFDVDLKCGIVHAYSDELSQQYAGANGAHRMKEALAVVKMEYVTPDKLDTSTDDYNWAIIPGEPTTNAMLSTSDPIPEIQLNEDALTQAYMKDERVYVNISGNVIDPSFDNAAVGATGELASIGLYDTHGYRIASVPLTRDAQYAGSPKGYFAQHPYLAKFDFGVVQLDGFSKNNETYVLKTSTNMIGNSGSLPIRVATGRVPAGDVKTDAQGASYISLAIFTENYPTHLGMRIGDGDIITLTKDSGDGLYSSVSGNSFQVQSLTDIGIEGVCKFPVYGGLVQYHALLTKAVESDVYYGKLTVVASRASEGNKSMLTLGSVSSYPQTKRGSYMPFTVRVGIPAGFSIDDFKFDIGGADVHDWNLKDDGYYYPTGPSRKVYIIVIRDGMYRLRAYDNTGLCGDWPLDKVAVSSINPNGYMNITFKGKFKDNILGIDAIRVNHVNVIGNRDDQRPVDPPLIPGIAEDPKSNSSVNYKLWRTASPEAIGTHIRIAYGRSSVTPLIQAIPEYVYHYPGSYSQDIAFLEWLKGKYDAGELDKIVTNVTLRKTTGVAPYAVTEKKGTLQDMRVIVKDMVTLGLPLLVSLQTTTVGGISATRIYDSTIGRLADNDELFEYLWYVDKMPVFKPAATWAGVPEDCLYAGIYAETRDDKWIGVVAESPPISGWVGDNIFRRRPAGGGIANMYFAQPYEELTGMYISDTLQRPGCPVGDLQANWSSYKDRNRFQSEVQLQFTPCVVVYAAMWRSAAEALSRGNPTKYPASILNNGSVEAWNNETAIDFGQVKASMSNAVMMAVEQYTVGFDKNGTPIGGIDMRVAAYLGPNGNKDSINLHYLNKAVDDQRDTAPFAFVTDFYNANAKNIKIYRNAYNSMVGQ